MNKVPVRESFSPSHFLGVDVMSRDWTQQGRTCLRVCHKPLILSLRFSACTFLWTYKAFFFLPQQVSLLCSFLVFQDHGGNILSMYRTQWKRRALEVVNFAAVRTCYFLPFIHMIYADRKNSLWSSKINRSTVHL